LRLREGRKGCLGSVMGCKRDLPEQDSAERKVSRNCHGDGDEIGLQIKRKGRGSGASETFHCMEQTH